MDYRQLLQPDRGQDAAALNLVDKASFDTWLGGQPREVRAALDLHNFKATPDSVAPVLLGDRLLVAVGVSDATTLGPWSLAKAAETLPPGTYRLASGTTGEAALGWLLAHYRYTRYRSSEDARGPRVLLTAEASRIEALVCEAEAVALVRDMVNTPAADMGPAEIEEAVRRVGDAHGARVTVTQGDALARDYPMIHAVGQAAVRSRAPRLIELEWGNAAHPRVAVVGKGVCFDTGGLDIKPSSGMRLMKKDMGGAAHALALARLVMEAQLPIRLHLLIPAVENAIAGNAFRPGDVLRSRLGPTVEIGNTDAEGRLILADALAKAMEEKPKLIVDFATLTGAARVALGPDLPATFANDDALAEQVLAAGQAVEDPLWRLPLHDGYDEILKSDIADLNNAPEGGMAGAVTAALFLRHFVSADIPWLHFDTFAWRPSARPGRPKGGEALGLRATWRLFRDRWR